MLILNFFEFLIDSIFEFDAHVLYYEFLACFKIYIKKVNIKKYKKF